MPSHEIQRLTEIDEDDDDLIVLSPFTNRKSSKKVKEEEIEEGTSKKKRNLTERFKDVSLLSPTVQTPEEIILLTDSDDDGDRIFLDDEEELNHNKQAVKPENDNAMEQVEIQLSSDSSGNSPASNKPTEITAEKNSSENVKVEEKPETDKPPERFNRKRLATKASRRSLQSLTATPIRKSSGVTKDKHTAEAEKRKKREKETREKTSIIKKVVDKIASLCWTRDSRSSFDEMHTTFQALLAVNSHFSIRYCEFLLKLDDKKFLDKVRYTAPECNISKLDNRARNKAVDVVTNVDNQYRIPRRSKTIKNVGARPFSFTRWANEQGELSIKYEKSVASGSALAPLGVIFDGERFFFSGGNKIFSCDEDGNHLNEHLKGLNHPTALCVVKPGRSIGFLERDRISIYYKHGNDVKRVANIRSYDRHSDLARGLTYVSCGGLVIAQREDNNEIYLRCYDIQQLDRLKSTYRYGFGKPSFMSSYDDIIYITDLDNRTIRSFKIEQVERTFTISPVHVFQLQTLPSNLKCDYPSGIVCDSRRELLVVDARMKGGAKIIWCDSFLQNWSRINIIDGDFPYCSQIAVSPSGTLFAACRQSHCMKIFKITS